MVLTGRAQPILAGTEIVSRAGRDPTGKTFEELYQGDYLASANGLYDDLRRRAQPRKG